MGEFPVEVYQAGCRDEVIELQAHLNPGDGKTLLKDSLKTEEKQCSWEVPEHVLHRVLRSLPSGS